MTADVYAYAVGDCDCGRKIRVSYGADGREIRRGWAKCPCGARVPVGLQYGFLVPAGPAPPYLDAKRKQKRRVRLYR